MNSGKKGSRVFSIARCDAALSLEKVWLGGEVFITAGLPHGDDVGLGFGHARLGQALDEGGLSLHGAQNSDWGGRLQVGVALPPSFRRRPE